MQRISFHAKVLGSILALCFTPVLAVERMVLSFSFWPFSSLQTLTLALIAGSWFTLFLMEKIYQDSYVTLTFSSYYVVQKIRVLYSSPTRKPYVIIQSLEGNRWVSQGRCDLTALPLSPEDQEKLASFLEYIPDQDNRRQQVLEYILNQFSHEALTQFYQALMGRTQNIV